VKRIANRNEAAMILKWKGLMAVFQAMPEEMVIKFTQIEYGERSESTVTSSPVCFGNVRGTKFVRITNLVNLLGTNYKEAGYLLAAPGGHITVTAIPLSKKINAEKWDESIFENLFHTLRVIQNSTSGGIN
jgi:hypothetical protein